MAVANASSQGVGECKAIKVVIYVIDLCNLAKNEYTKNNLGENMHNPKKFWDQLLQMRDDGKVKSNPNKLSLTDPATWNDSATDETANVFNNFFTT